MWPSRVSGTGGVIYVYIAETSPTDCRSFFLLIYTLFVGLGLMTSAILGALFHWRTVAAVFAVMCAVGFVAPFFVPSTPMWLRSRGRNEEARKVEKWFGFEPDRIDDLPTLPPPPWLQQGPMAQQPQQRQMQQYRAPVQRLPSRNADRRTEREHRGDNSGCSGGNRRTGSRLAPWSQSQRCATRIGCLAVRCSHASCFVCSCYLH